MNETIQVLGIEINNLNAKDAVKKVMSYMEAEPMKIVELVTMNTIGQFQELEDTGEIFEKIDLVLASDKGILQAAGVDALNMLVWMQTKDAAKNWNRPKSILKEMLEDPDVPEIVAFESGEAFEKERQAIIEGVA